jgi:hypothetical protein
MIIRHGKEFVAYLLEEQIIDLKLRD